MLDSLKNRDIPQAKKDFDDVLTERVVEPLAEKGYPDLGAGLATAASTATEYLVPDSPEELAMAALPVGKLGKVAKSAEKLEALKPIFKNLNNNAERKWDFVGKGVKYLDELSPSNARSQQLEKLKKLFLD